MTSRWLSNPSGDWPLDYPKVRFATRQPLEERGGLKAHLAGTVIEGGYQRANTLAASVTSERVRDSQADQRLALGIPHAFEGRELVGRRVHSEDDCRRCAGTVVRVGEHRRYRCPMRAQLVGDEPAKSSRDRQPREPQRLRLKGRQRRGGHHPDRAVERELAARDRRAGKELNGFRLGASALPWPGGLSTSEAPSTIDEMASQGRRRRPSTRISESSSRSPATRSSFGPELTRPRTEAASR